MNPDLKSGRMESGAGGLQELLAIHFPIKNIILLTELKNRLVKHQLGYPADFDLKRLPVQQTRRS